MAANAYLSRLPIHYTDNDFICQFDKFSSLCKLTMYIGYFLYNFSHKFYSGQKDGQLSGGIYSIFTVGIRKCAFGISCLFMVRLWVSTVESTCFINKMDVSQNEIICEISGIYGGGAEGAVDRVQKQEETACRIIRQYNREPLSDEDMKKLQEIAEAYCQVKNYVYDRYGGIRSLSKLYPGYTVQNEMTDSGLRAELAMPSVYFYRAVFDALGDIKSQWAKTKTKLLKLIGQNESFTPQEKHFLRFLIKSPNAFEAVLNQKAVRLPGEMQDKYEELAAETDSEKLCRYLNRQVRKYHLRKLHTDSTRGFYITERAYRYGVDKETGKRHGIFIATKENRKRIFVPLTDENVYDRQLFIRLKLDENGIEIHIPLEIKKKTHRDYTREIGLSMGIEHMLTTHDGKTYGEQFGALHREFVSYMNESTAAYRREKENNAGRKKYFAKKARLDAKAESYVNHEINRLMEEEKPKILYLPKLPKNSPAGYNKKINYSVGVWRKGLVRERLRQKCMEHSVEIVEVFGRAISVACSNCGETGKYDGDRFRCGVCGYEADKKVNAARNALKRGQEAREGS